MRDRRVLVHMHGGGVWEESEETFTGGGRERWIKMMVEVGIEADDQRGIGGQSRVKTLYATDLTPPFSSSSSFSHRKKSIDRHASSYNSMAPFFPFEEKSPNRVPRPEIRSNSVENGRLDVSIAGGPICPVFERAGREQGWTKGKRK